jgi:hypothetical protein
VSIAVPDIAFTLSVLEALDEPRARVEAGVPPNETGSTGLCSFCLSVWKATTESELRWTVLADPFLVFVRPLVRRSRRIYPEVCEYCSNMVKSA